MPPLKLIMCPSSPRTDQGSEISVPQSGGQPLRRLATCARLSGTREYRVVSNVTKRGLDAVDRDNVGVTWRGRDVGEFEEYGTLNDIRKHLRLVCGLMARRAIVPFLNTVKEIQTRR